MTEKLPFRQLRMRDVILKRTCLKITAKFILQKFNDQRNLLMCNDTKEELTSLYLSGCKCFIFNVGFRYTVDKSQ